MRILRWSVYAALSLFLASSWGAPARSGMRRDAITAAAIRHHVFFLAGEELGGRGLGSPGLRTASFYAASQFRAGGLRPAFEDGKRLSYFQPVPVVRRSIASPPVLEIRTASGARPLVHGRDFKWFVGSPPPDGGRPRALIDAGYAIHEPESGWDDLRGLDLRDQAVLIRLGIPAKGLPETLVARYGPFGSFLRKVTDLIPLDPAIVLIPLPPEMDPDWTEIPTIESNPPFAYRDRAPGAVAVPFVAVLRSEVAKALAPGAAIVVSAPTVDEDLEAQNVAGWVEGRDSSLKDEVVVVSAHLDHLPTPPGGEIFPGANDNASGAAAVLEIAEAMAQDPPRRSVLFVLFTAEEGGAMGALHFLSRPPFPRSRIVADLNMDMIGRHEDGSAGRVQYALDASVVQASFPSLIREVNDRSERWPLRFEHPGGLGDSDHRIFEAFRIPAVNFYTGKVVDTHKATDTPEKIDYDKAEGIARLVFEIARELAERSAPWE